MRMHAGPITVANAFSSPLKKPLTHMVRDEPAASGGPRNASSSRVSDVARRSDKFAEEMPSVSSACCE